MKKMKFWKQVTALALSAVLLIPAQGAYAMEGEIETHAEDDAADTVGFEIRDGVLTRYTGTETKVTIPEGVTEIGFMAFEHCDNITEVTIPGSVKVIKNGAFDFCTNLTSVKISEGLERIGDGVFFACSSLTDIRLPESVKELGEGMFEGCTFTSMEIPAGVTSIGAGLFDGCNDLTSVTVKAGNPKYDSRGNCNAIIETASNKLIAGCKGTVIPDSVTSIGDKAFLWCRSLEGINIPGSVAEIEEAAFQGSGLKSITIPGSVKTIEKFVFSECPELKSVNIMEGVERIVGSSFNNCDRLRKVSIPNSLTSIGEGAFDYDRKLASITVGEGNLTYDSRGNCDAIIETASNKLIVGSINTVIPDSVTSIGKLAFSMRELVSIAIPEGVTNIGEDAFTQCWELRGVSIPESVKTIGEDAFADCEDLTIYGKRGSYAETYANENEIPFLEGPMPEFAKTSIASCNVELDTSSYVYDGTPKKPGVTVKDGDKVLDEDADYKVTYQNNVNAGTADVIVTGKGGYSGTKTVNFTIVNSGGNQTTSITCKQTVYKTAYGAKPFKIDATSKSALTFTSSDAKIAAVDKNTGTVTIKGTGIAEITVRSESDSVKVTVKVSPKKASLKSAKAAKGKKLTVKWAKDKNASGYQVQVSTDKSFKKNRKQKNATKPSYTFAKLKAGKKYYVRVRSYKKSGKETLYGAWSGKKQSDKVKK